MLPGRRWSVLAHQLAQVGGLQLQRGGDSALGRQLAGVVPQLYSALLELPRDELAMACAQLQEQPCIWVRCALLLLLLLLLLPLPHPAAACPCTGCPPPLPPFPGPLHALHPPALRGCAACP
jgi:hypothetical protein